MTILSKQIEDTERKAQALLADLIPLVHDDIVSQDPEFICLLEKALNQAEHRLACARADAIQIDQDRPRESSPDKPRETPTP